MTLQITPVAESRLVTLNELSAMSRKKISYELMSHQPSTIDQLLTRGSPGGPRNHLLKLRGDHVRRRLLGRDQAQCEGRIGFRFVVLEMNR